MIEIGRKIRSPKDEEPGVNSYSFLWGRRNAVLAWLGAMLMTAVAACMAAEQIGFFSAVAGLLGLLLLTVGFVAVRFLQEPVPRRAKWIETLSGIWTLLLYLSLGTVPLLWRWWTTTGGA